MEALRAALTGGTPSTVSASYKSQPQLAETVLGVPLFFPGHAISPRSGRIG